MVQSNYYRNFLAEIEKEAYDRILKCWESHLPAVVLPPSYSNNRNSTGIIKAVALDHPEVFWVDYYHYSEINTFLSTILSFNYFMSHHERIEAEAEMNAWKKYILQYMASSTKPEGKLWMIYDYLSRQVRYAERGAKYSHTLLGCIPSFGHSAVCEGISKGYKFLANAVDLPCVIIEGRIHLEGRKPIPHAWNMVESSRGQLHIDVLQPGLFLKDDQGMTGYMWERR